MTTILTASITAAGTFNSSNFNVLKRTGNRGLSVQMNFTYGSAGTSVDATLQTSLDGGTTWCDIWHHQFTTSTARQLCNLEQISSLADTDGTAALPASPSPTNIRDGFLGPMLRVHYVVVAGTAYAGTTLQVDVYGDQLQVNPAPSE